MQERLDEEINKKLCCDKNALMTVQFFKPWPFYLGYDMQIDLFSGRDKNVWMTDLKSTDRRALVCQESAPVLKMVLTPVIINGPMSRRSMLGRSL